MHNFIPILSVHKMTGVAAQCEGPLVGAKHTQLELMQSDLIRSKLVPVVRGGRRVGEGVREVLKCPTTCN